MEPCLGLKESALLPGSGLGEGVKWYAKMTLGDKRESYRLDNQQATDISAYKRKDKERDSEGPSQLFLSREEILSLFKDSINVTLQ